MNAIYGSNNKEKFLALQNLNDGKFKVNHGMILIDKKGYDIHKVYSDAKDFKFPKRKNYSIYMGISEKKTRKFYPEKISPFISEQWVVSFYGDIFNYKELVEEFVDDAASSKTQGFAISELLEKISEHDIDDVNVMANGLSLIEGHFALWSHNAFTGNSFIAKVNTNLFADVYENTFSTNKFENSEQLRDGELYQLTMEGITNVRLFDYC